MGEQLEKNILVLQKYKIYYEHEVIILHLIGLSKRPPPSFRHCCHNGKVCQMHQQLFKLKQLLLHFFSVGLIII